MSSPCCDRRWWIRGWRKALEDHFWRLSKKNYIPTSARQDYGKAFVREFRKFLDVSDGERKIADSRIGYIKTWTPVEIKGNALKVNFERYNKEAKNIDEGCMTIDVTADMNGKIIKKKKTISVCDDAY